MTILSLLVAEGVLRGKDWLKDFYYSDRSPESLLWIYDPLLGWRKEPQFSGIFTRPEINVRTIVKTNAHGHRDDEIPLEKEPLEKRILFLGDSYVVGLEVPQEKTMSEWLEKDLSQDMKANVINAGTRGYGTDQNLLYFIQEGKELKPDLVIYGFYANDPENNVTIHRPYRKFGKPYFLINKEGDLTLKGVPVPKFFEPKDIWLVSNPEFQEFYRLPERPALPSKSFFRLWDLVQNIIANKNYHPIEFAPKPSAALDYEKAITEALLVEMDRQVKKNGSQFLVYEISRGLEASGAPFLEGFCLKNNIPYVSGMSEFYRRSKGKRTFVFNRDNHLNAKGHKLTAEIIAQAIRAKNLLP